MLPFLKSRKAGSIMKAHYADGGMTTPEEAGEPNHALVAAAEDILSAIAMKDSGALADALEAAFQICDMEPHMEGPHEEGME